MFTIVECGPCGGHFYPGSNVLTGQHIFAMCSDCGHEVSESDILPNMEEGEVLVFDQEDRLAYVTA